MPYQSPGIFQKANQESRENGGIRSILTQRLAEGIEGTAYICMRSGLYSAGRLKTTNGSITDNQIDLLMLFDG